MGNMPTLQEVKEYFKNADTIISIQSNREDNITEKFELVSKKWYIKGSEYGAEVWNENKGYAKILTHKKPTYTITKEQILELENGFTLPKLKQWFPDVFEVKLEAGKWYKAIGIKAGCLGFQGIGLYTNEEIQSGFTLNCNKKSIGLKGVNGRVWGVLADKFEESTEQEVFEALKNEAVNRGFKEGAYVKRNQEMLDERGTPRAKEEVLIENNVFIFSLEENYISIDGRVIFSDGKWAEIIPTLTKKEAEEKLNCKIV